MAKLLCCVDDPNLIGHLATVMATEFVLAPWDPEDFGPAGRACAFLVEEGRADPVRVVADLRQAGHRQPFVAMARTEQGRAELRIRFGNHRVSTRDVCLISTNDPDTIANTMRDLVSRYQRRRTADTRLRNEASDLAFERGREVVRRAYIDQVLDHAPVGVLLLDADRRIVSVNRYGAELFGAGEVELCGTRLKDHFPENQGSALDAAADAGGAPGELPVEASLRLQSGLVRHLAIQVVPLSHLRDAAPAMAIIQDITARVEAMLAAARANAAKSQFLANMSHELRTPLNAIIGFSDIMRNQAFGPIVDERYVQYAADINDSGNHLLHVINDILDISKLEAGKLELDESECDLAQTVESVLRFVRQSAARGSVTLIQDGLDTLPRVRADARRLKQIFVNLLSNAVKFTPAGGTVTIRGHPARDGEAVSISVADTGVGMSKDDIPRALTAFDQIDSHLSRRHEGTGLGLPLTKSLAELHGGTIAIESEPGKGTTVTVSLPADRAVASPAAAARAG